MKKFVTATVIVLLIFLSLHYLVYNQGLYLDFDEETNIKTVAKISDKEIFVLQDGNYVPFQVKGVDVVSNLPGHYPTDFAADKEIYFRWLKQIHEMGANTVKVDTIMDDDFYNAFYDYNMSITESPLYLIQSLYITDYANNSSQDAYSESFYGSLREDAFDAIDIFHGRKNIAKNRVKGSGKYRKDISQWVLGLVLGTEWNSGTIAYTDHNRAGTTAYRGKYISAASDASPFESMLAKVMDQTLSYETNKYEEQHLISFINDPNNDPFEYESIYGYQLGKYNVVDLEHIVVEDQVKSGVFASYRLYGLCDNYSEYFSKEEKLRLQNILPNIDQSRIYEGYPELLNQYHTMPVFIAGYGFSTSRGMEDPEQASPFTEEQQGEALMNTYEDIVASGCMGAIINTWQDVWSRRTWNTSYAVDVNHSQEWSDAQTVGQGYGLMAFDPGDEESVCYVDGQTLEWGGGQVIMQNDEIGLSAQYDERYLYLMATKEGLSEKDQLYIAIDTTPKSGSTFCKNYNLYFQRPADFLICINGEENSRVFVQERYEALRENYLMETAGEDPFVQYPEKDSPVFVPIRMILKKNIIVEDTIDYEQYMKLQLSKTYETGRLKLGNGNPSSLNYDSQADFCYGKDTVEIRIPWQLINFSNPSDMQIHDDYYENYGVKNLNIGECYLSAGTSNNGDQILEMGRLKLDGWRHNVKYHERLKRSYNIVKEGWSNE